MTDTVRARTPWHLWAVGLLAMAWNAFGAMDYTMTKLNGEAWLRQMQMTDAQIAYTLAMPAWMSAAWAIGVWGGVLGGLLLLLRSRLAVPVFAASLVAYVASLVYTYGLSDGAAIAGGPQIYVMQAVILAGCLFFLWYARRAAALGRLG
jgi:hypothetical protein